MTTPSEITVLASSLEVRERLVEALKLDPVGPWVGHALAEERLPGWVRPSNWYLTGFLIPSGTPPEHSSDPDEDEEVGEVPETAGLAEENTEDRRAAKKSFFPSSMGLSFLVSEKARALEVHVRWGEYTPVEVEGQGAYEDPRNRIRQKSRNDSPTPEFRPAPFLPAEFYSSALPKSLKFLLHCLRRFDFACRPERSQPGRGTARKGQA
jgi:hypothetical protein